MLILWSFIAKPQLLDWLDELETEVLSWQDTSLERHKYGGLQFNCGQQELGHIHGNGLLDILFSLKIKQLLMKEGKIEDHHRFSSSGWISFHLRNYEDAVYAKELMALAYRKCKEIRQHDDGNRKLS
ncbi:DUF5519 family protein [Pedobacter sp. MC2016-14]|uniref:luciferase domain-containing protein n=1 Tax=Pedobacter sp. MC2016-14 TaxID=2897327 RepID=UPI001E51D0CD|nr:luciferase family protein [Pedobacter sp. MC2016-14]MCD0489543.1 DUF5519 family protein [Pedobacter sp. MC2016-14]